MGHGGGSGEHSGSIGWAEGEPTSLIEAGLEDNSGSIDWEGESIRIRRPGVQVHSGSIGWRGEESIRIRRPGLGSTLDP